jgi:hypothetical protein
MQNATIYYISFSAASNRVSHFDFSRITIRGHVLSGPFKVYLKEEGRETHTRSRGDN